MTGDGDEPGDGPDGERRPDEGTATSRPLLRRVGGPIDAGSGPPPKVILRREFKGLTVADLLQHETAERLPGRARSALHHLLRGDLRAADAALPGEFAPVLQGPGHRRRDHTRLVLWLTAIAVGAAAFAASMWF